MGRRLPGPPSPLAPMPVAVGTLAVHEHCSRHRWRRGQTARMDDRRTTSMRTPLGEMAPAGAVRLGASPQAGTARKATGDCLPGRSHRGATENPPPAWGRAPGRPCRRVTEGRRVMGGSPPGRSSRRSAWGHTPERSARRDCGSSPRFGVIPAECSVGEHHLVIICPYPFCDALEAARCERSA